MFRAFVVTPDEGAATALARLALASREVAIARRMDSYPRSFEFARLLAGFAPDIVFLDLSDWERGWALLAECQAHSPAIAVVGFGIGEVEAGVLGAARALMPELLVSPVTERQFMEIVHRAIHKVRAEVAGNLLAFLPAKAGSGCTTVTLNLGGRLARDCGKRVLILEADLHSGVLSVLLNCAIPSSLQETLEEAGELDASRWERGVARALGMDLLLADRARKGPLPSWTRYYHLLQFVKSRYDAILVDLPEVVNDATEELIRRARMVSVVCTPELQSLTLAGQRCQELGSRGVPAERVSIVVNRWHETDMAPSEIESLLGRRVAAVLVNDYQAVKQAALETTLIGKETQLGGLLLDFARALASESGSPVVPVRRNDSWLKRVGKILVG